MAFSPCSPGWRCWEAHGARTQLLCWEMLQFAFRHMPKHVPIYMGTAQVQGGGWVLVSKDLTLLNRVWTLEQGF